MPIALLVRGSLAVAASVTSLVGLGGVAQAEEPVSLGGGAGIVVDSASCTLTTIGRDRAGRLVGFTAGHCGQPGASVTAERDRGGGRIGRIALVDDRLDYAVIAFDADRVAPSARVDNFVITAVGAPAQFPVAVCKKGRTTGTSCGPVWGDVAMTGSETWTQMCVLPGDSGAPVTAGTVLVGMVNAYIGVGCLGPEVGTTMAAVLADADARGDLGAGFRPAADVGT
ncbi:serine protease [Nocardia terpenica]|uniref:Serine protease n=1 Tax=Nocardia terpenica TaxID=455432 RepID=A0A6G9Z278_9NOCA|nr:serine protease [Nocardia terpenica]QIS19618.1 serine protease [Nocardia terpenica]